MLALSNCTAEEIRNAPAEGAACVDPVFAPMPLIGDDRAPGLAEGAPAVAVKYCAGAPGAPRGAIALGFSRGFL